MPSTTTTTSRPKLRAGVLYLCDNGACRCGAHAGQTARYTGRDISGQPVLPITGATLREARAMGMEPKCEQPGCNVVAR